ncbi:MAG TPA: TlpA disulfide reductase family protein [Bryobacteraceae bacterium]|nr:TlpA disulfide reductase family protein [Bryobacteraceae bacterium]
MAKSAADRTLRILMAVLFIVFGFVIKDAFTEHVVQAGDSAPDFSIRTDDGKTITKSSFGGRLLVLNFWATWCPPCIEEMPSLDAFARQMQTAGVVVLGVSVDKSDEAYKRFLKRARPAFLTARDPEANISSDYGTYKWPETYIIDRTGKVIQKHIGPKDWTDPNIVNEIKALL